MYVRPFPGPGGRWQVSTGGGNFPLWSRDGRELLFQTLDQRVMAVSYTATHTAGGDSFAAGKPRVWTDDKGVVNGDLKPANIMITPLGSRQSSRLRSGRRVSTVHGWRSQ